MAEFHRYFTIFEDNQNLTFRNVGWVIEDRHTNKKIENPNKKHLDFCFKELFEEIRKAYTNHN